MHEYSGFYKLLLSVLEQTDRAGKKRGEKMANIEKFRGAVLGEVCGDALGYPLVTLNTGKIIRHYGPLGLRTMVKPKDKNAKALISDNSQMMLAAIDGLLWGDAKKLTPRDGVYRGLMRWYYSQTGEEPKRGQKTWTRRQPHEKKVCLVRERFMHERRMPEQGVLNALSNEKKGTIKVTVNESKGSAVLTRNVPTGLLFAKEPEQAFMEGVANSALTHSEPTAYLAGGAVASLTAYLASGLSLPKSLAKVARMLATAKGGDEVTLLLTAAIEQANKHPAGKGGAWDHLDSIRSLGTGDTAAEALAIAVYCINAVDDPFEAIVVAANHDGRSTVTAALTGALEGVRFGDSFLPAYWTDDVEGGDIARQMADMLFVTEEKREV